MTDSVVSFVGLMVFENEALTEAIAKDLERWLKAINDAPERGDSSVLSLKEFVQPLHFCPENCGPDGNQLMLLGGPDFDQPSGASRKNPDDACFAVRFPQWQGIGTRLRMYGFRCGSLETTQKVFKALRDALQNHKGYLGDMVVQARVEWPHPSRPQTRP